MAALKTFHKSIKTGILKCSRQLRSVKFYSSQNMESANWPIVKIEEVQNFIVRALEAVGTKSEHAKIMAEILMIADYRGHYSHGMNRVGKNIS